MPFTVLLGPKVRLLLYSIAVLHIGLHTSLHVNAAYCYRVALSVSLSTTIVSPAKTAEPIEVPFGLWTRFCQRNHVLDGVACRMRRGQF